MQDLKLLSGYSLEETLREKLYPLFDTVFGIPVATFRDFYARGFWNPTYQPYTFFAGDRAVANVSMFTLPLQINQKRVQAAGIQSVMTDPEFRGNGLMKQLFEQMLIELDRTFDIAFLFTEKPELYTRYGFRQVQEHTFLAVAPERFQQAGQRTTSSLRKLDFSQESDIALIRECFKNHAPVSGRFAPLSYESSFFLNLYSPFYQEKLYYSSELHVILVFDVKEYKLRLFDVIGEKLPTLEELCTQIQEPFSEMQFYFSPDRFCESFEPVVLEQKLLMVRGDFEIEQEAFKFPLTAAF